MNSFSENIRGWDAKANPLAARSQRYATTTETDFLLKQIAAKVGVPLQEYGVRNDMREPHFLLLVVKPSCSACRLMALLDPRFTACGSTIGGLLSLVQLVGDAL